MSQDTGRKQICGYAVQIERSLCKNSSPITAESDVDSSSQRRQDNADEEESAEARQEDEAGPSTSRKPKQFSDEGMPL